MDKESEWKMLFDANAKLNSPEAQAAIKQLATLQHLSDEEMRATAPAAEPIELPYVPSVAKTVVEMKNQLRVLQDSLDAERQARIDSEKIAMRQRRIERIRFWSSLIATIIGSIAAVASVIATIVLS